MIRILTCCAIWLSALAFSNAESVLRWDHKQLAFHPVAGEKTVKAEFGFTNTGTQTAKIDSVRPSCGCTTIALEKKSFEPGERGSITAVFTIGQRKGMQAKGIRISVHGESDPTDLMMVTYVEEGIKMEPQFVFWRTGEEPKPKTIKLVMPSSTQLRLGKVVSSDSRISAAVEPVKEGACYNLIVRPLNTENPVTAVLRIEAAAPSSEAKIFKAYAQVKEANRSDFSKKEQPRMDTNIRE